MNIRPQYLTVQARLRRIADSRFWYISRADQELMGRAAGIISRLVARVSELDLTIASLRASEPTFASEMVTDPEAGRRFVEAWIGSRTGKNVHEEWVRDGRMVKANWATGDGAAYQGRVVAYSERPTLTIELAGGLRVTWVADLCTAVDAAPFGVDRPDYDEHAESIGNPEARPCRLPKNAPPCVTCRCGADREHKTGASDGHR